MGLISLFFQVFHFADKYRGAYSNGLKKDVCPYYCSYSGYEVKFMMLLSLSITSAIFMREFKLNKSHAYGWFQNGRMSCCGALLGCIRLPKTQLILTTFKLMGRPLELHNLTIPLVGITSMLEQGFFSPRSHFHSCFFSFFFFNCFSKC